MESFWQDLRFGARMLRKQPAFSAVAVVALALGIGANTAIFSVINALLLRPLPFKHADRLVYVWETNPKIGLDRGIVSPPDFADWREQNGVFEHISAFRTWFYRLSGGGDPEQVWGVRTSASFFELLGVEPQTGRTILPEEEQPGRDQVVIISHGLWERRFGADPGLIGHAITIDDRPFTVIGILPGDFDLFGRKRAYDIWMPFDFERGQSRRDDYSLLVFARLKAGVKLDQAQVEMNAIAEGLERQYPETNQNRGVKVITLQENQALSLRPALLILLAAVGFVLLIACANVANLLLAREVTRQRESAVRMALGASQGRLIRQLLTESVLLASLGGASGLMLASWGLDLLRAALPAGVDEIPRADWIRIDPMVLGFTLLISLLTGVVFGLAPAVVSRPNLNEALKDGRKSLAGSGRGRRLRDSLVVTEVALATVLLLGAGLMLRSFDKLTAVEPGFDPENLLTMQVWLPESKYTDGKKIAAFYQQTLERIREVPGVRSASGINFLPLSGWGDMTGFAIEGRAAPPPGQELVAEYRVIDSDYFRVMGIPLLKGRPFDEHDREEAHGVALINEAMARRYWPGDDPLGKRIRPDFPETRTPWRPIAGKAWLTVVGVAGDVKEVKELGHIDETLPEFYLPYPQNPSALMRLVVRTDAEPMSLVPALRRGLLDVDKDQPFTEIKSMKQFISESVFRSRFNTILLGVFAAVALLLAVVGIYGVITYSVTQRTREVGIRMALGATARDVLSMIVGQGMKLSLAGVGIGLAAALALTRVMRTLLFGVSATDTLTFVVVASLLAAMSLVACVVPARRAMKVDPMEALRHE
jgi:putative ABC transport system permease protein